MERRSELTLRGLVLGCAITLVFTAANVYLGLKVGLTFASTIPAAVISMAVLRALRNATIYENNIVQTVASAAGTLSAIIFVLPGLVMIGWWSGFPFGVSFGICAIGGILGVMYSVPLRRALVTTSSLPYPEGVAAAEVLKVGTAAGSTSAGERAGLAALVGGTAASSLFAAVVATRIFAAQIGAFFRAGNAATGLGFSLSLALVGAGQLIGLTVGIAILTGLVIAWGIATPLLTAAHPASGAAADVATAVWSHQVRFIGAGAIGVAALWSLGRIARPVATGIASAMLAARRRRRGEGANLPRTEQDLPIALVGLVSLFCLVPLGVLLWTFLASGPLAALAVPMTSAAIVYVVIAGFFVAAACGYMAGLIGSSNSPVSGLAILSVIGASLIVLAIAKGAGAPMHVQLVAYALVVTAVLLCVATISNDNLQDLKTGQLVDATPWRQQVALIVGVVMGAIVIPPILQLLNHAYGFAGAPHLGSAGTQPLPAPQATLISALAKGVIGGQIDWRLIGIGAVVGALVVAADEALRARRLALPPLAVGLGIYLPASTTAPVVLGAILGWAYNRWAAGRPHPDRAKQLGVLVASGLIVGESIFGVLLAGLIVFSGNPSPLALVGDAFAPAANYVGTAAFVLAIAALFTLARRTLSDTRS
ncbi:MAG: oligopeptide transporter, OPT family [Candidatus Eremiobacteraeota bacterium]|nr:oligopeptide transporter, OPT family [Candidatus Eremiobacteraeota bacterium]MBV8499996.1 oligopeptide transporter, OPT family [Candidatus Eremiobacteraeota bacterium]